MNDKQIEDFKKLYNANTFRITFWAKKHKKHITRNAKWTELCRFFKSKNGVPCITYYDLEKQGYRTATTTWKVQL